MKRTKLYATNFATVLVFLCIAPSPIYAESLNSAAQGWNYPVKSSDSKYQHMTYEECEISNIFREFISRAEACDVLLDRYETLVSSYVSLTEHNMTEDNSSLLVPGNDNLQTNYNRKHMRFLDYFFYNSKSLLNEGQINRYNALSSEIREHNILLRAETNTDRVLSQSRIRDPRFSPLNDHYIEFHNKGTEYYPQYVSVVIGNFRLFLNSNLTELCYEYATGDYTPSELIGIDDDFMEGHPGLHFISSATYRYNGHSYAWISTSTSNNYWVDTLNNWPNQSSFVGTNCAASAGDIIVFMVNGVAEHSAIVSSGGSSANTITVTAKMGKAGVYSSSLTAMMRSYPGATYEVHRLP